MRSKILTNIQRNNPTYSTTSGSTGEPKIIVYRNEIAADGEHYIKYPDSFTELGATIYNQRTAEKFGSKFAQKILSHRTGRLKFGTMLNLEGIVAFDMLFPPYGLGPGDDMLPNDEIDIYIFGFNAELYGPTIERFKIDTIFLYVPLLIQLGYFLHQQFEYIFVDSRFG